ncbi:hypothetical protein FOCC_FOCC006384 [Frankliniella occidentalis]|nr:hypothetical protein FOCC_FOCC006384 [Frankliniella occidentalis]
MVMIIMEAPSTFLPYVNDHLKFHSFCFWKKIIHIFSDYINKFDVIHFGSFKCFLMVYINKWVHRRICILVSSSKLIINLGIDFKFIPLLIISKFIIICRGNLHRNAGSALLQFLNAITAISYFIDLKCLLVIHCNTISTVCITKCKKNYGCMSLLNFIMTDTSFLFLPRYYTFTC